MWTCHNRMQRESEREERGREKGGGRERTSEGGERGVGGKSERENGGGRARARGQLGSKNAQIQKLEHLLGAGADHHTLPRMPHQG